ncbi:chemotaxis protein CheY [Candidatus Magnetomorum sp. HK-1]|nr:chemotaxis protein CheY [Candidatus Magnetomorum sp. HK-1]
MRNIFKIIHLDDNPVFFKVLERNLRRIKDIDILYRATTRKDKLEQMITDSLPDLPDLFISDLMLKDDHDATQGINFVKKINSQYPSLKIMVLSARSDQTIKEDLKPHITKYQTKSYLPRQFTKDIIALLKGENA